MSMFAAIRTRLFRAFGDWAIQRAMRTPYTHLFHDDGRPYMQRFWLLRIGMPKGWRKMGQDAQSIEDMAAWFDSVHQQEPARRARTEASSIREKLYPRFGIRIHRIMSSDARAFHDHPWNYTTLILRGGYTEITPAGDFRASQVEMAADYDGTEPTTYTQSRAVRYDAGSLLRRHATSWHYLVLKPGEDAWTLFCTGRKQQTWGFLVDGLLKVPYGLYLQRRREHAQRGAAA